MHYLAVCAIIKNEDFYLREWVAYHAALGVEHFYLYDNGSARNQARCLEGFEAGRFTFISWPGKEMQIPAYNHCLNNFGAQCRWLAFIDVDEFLCPLQDDDLRPLLAEYEDYAGLAVPWLLFGSSGHLRRPDGLVIENFQETLPEEYDGRHNVIKCIVDPARIKAAIDPHRFEPELGQAIVSEDHRPIPFGEARALRHCAKIQLNHYFYRSQEEFEAKLARGRADRADKEAEYPYAQFYTQARDARLPNRAIQRFVPQTRQAMLRPGSLPSPRGCEAQFHEIIEPAADLLRLNRAGQAEALLCASAETSKHLSEFWLMRCLLTRQAGHKERALHFAYKALYYSETLEAYWELYQCRLALGQPEEARKPLFCLRDWAKRRSRNEPAAAVWLERAEKEWAQLTTDNGGDGGGGGGGSAARAVHA